MTAIEALRIGDINAALSQLVQQAIVGTNGVFKLSSRKLGASA